MKLLKKWLFPALTCLIVLGAAVLPPLVSQARDVREFGQVHAELLNADALPAAQTPTLLDRITLYASRYSTSNPILSFQDHAHFENSEARSLAQSAQELLTEAGVLPKWIFEEEPFEHINASLLLLWDPAEKTASREPSAFWEISWSYDSNKSHQKSIRLITDANTGLPVHLYVHDTNMSQWLPYDTDHLRTLSEHFFDLLGLEIRETDPHGSGYVPSLDLSYSIAGSEMIFLVSRAPTDLFLQPELNWQPKMDADSGPIHAAG